MIPNYLPSITTHSKNSGSTWRTKLGEIVSLQIRSFGIFVTGLNTTERAEFFDLLLKAKNLFHFTIPFCHAVSSMRDSEFRFLTKEFGTQWFNLHPLSQYPLEHELSLTVRQKICIENADFTRRLTVEDCAGFNGLCLDLSHLQDTRTSLPEIYESIIKLTETIPVRANHISGFSSTIQSTHERYGKTYHHYSDHFASKLSEFDYVHTLPSITHATVAALELEIPIVQQLAIVQRLQTNATRLIAEAA